MMTEMPDMMAANNSGLDSGANNMFQLSNLASSMGVGGSLPSVQDNDASIMYTGLTNFYRLINLKGAEAGVGGGVSLAQNNGGSNMFVFLI